MTPSSIIGREILDSRGNPTVEVDVVLEEACSAAPRFRRAPRPARMRRSNCATAIQKRYLSQGVTKAVAAVTGEIFDAIGGMDAEQQAKIDETLIALDGTPNKGRPAPMRSRRTAGGGGRRRSARCRSIATSAALWRGCCRCR